MVAQRQRLIRIVSVGMVGPVVVLGTWRACGGSKLRVPSPIASRGAPPQFADAPAADVDGYEWR